MRIHLVGAGGFAREVLDIVEALADHGDALSIAGIYAEGGADRSELEARGYTVSGPLDALPAPGADDRFVIGFADPAGRERIDARLRDAGWLAASLIHPAATLGSGNTVGAGAVICAGVRLTTNISLGRHVHINLNATIGHDAKLADYVTVNPLASVSGRVDIGTRSTIGTGANINERLTIGADAVVGSGSVVIRDVAAATTVAGAPARPLSDRDG